MHALLSVALAVATLTPIAQQAALDKQMHELIDRQAKWMRFTSVDDVPVGRYVTHLHDGKRIEFVLRREENGFRFESFDARGKREAAHSELVGDHTLTLPGHHGIRFAVVDGKPALEVLYCYVRYFASPAET